METALHPCRSFAAIAALTLSAACSHHPGPAPAGPDTPQPAADHAQTCAGHHGLDATLWARTSAEYQATALQTFRHATLQLERALADPTWTAALEQDPSEMADLPPAIIVDVDETILDNSPFQARLVADDLVYGPDVWNPWVEKSTAEALSGAKDFLTRADELGVTIFYVTNRTAETEAATRVNLELQDMPLDARDTVLMKGENGWESDKTTRRQAVATTHRILLLLGDDLNDFVSGAKATEPGPRRELAESHAAMWGERWFLLPNPSYGSWEASLFGRQYELSEPEKQRLKARHLAPFEP